MKKIKSIFLCCLLALSFGVANAEGFIAEKYAGLGIGQSFSDVFGNFNSLSAITTNDKDTAWKIFYGLSFKNNFGLEFEYNNLGDFSLEETSTSTKGTMEYQSIGVAGQLKSMVTPRVQLFAKLGIHYWDVDANLSSSLLSSYSDSGNGADAFGGVGVNFLLGNNFYTRIEYERFTFGSGYEDVDLFSASLIRKF